MSTMKIDKTNIKNAEVFQILMENFPDMVHSVDDTGKIIYANRQAREVLGYSNDELLEMHVYSIYADSIQEQLTEGFKSLKLTGEIRVESSLKTKSGNEVPVEIRSFSIYDDSGDFLHTFSVSRDLRKIKELQADLVHAGGLAAIGELSAGIAHDINNPVTVIQASCQLLDYVMPALADSSGVSDEFLQLKEYLDDIKKASLVIGRLAQSMLGFSRKCRGKLVLINVSELIEEAAFISKYRLKNNGVTLINKLSSKEFFSLGEPGQLVQVFVNLMVNAADAMAKVDGKRQIVVSAEQCQHAGKDIINITITDTGSGIPKELKDRIFDSFFTTKEGDKGTGLGLSIAKAILKDHRGNVRVAQTGSTGTTFVIRLPKAENS